MFKLSLKIIIFCHNSIIITNNSQKRIPPPQVYSGKVFPGLFHMTGELRMIINTAERIKELRLKNNMTQTELAKRLYITRSSVNAWEMATSIPSTEKITELCQLLHTSADYLLGLSEDESIPLARYTQDEKEIIYRLIRYFDTCHQTHKEK